MNLIKIDYLCNTQVLESLPTFNFWTVIGKWTAQMRSFIPFSLSSSSRSVRVRLHRLHGSIGPWCPRLVYHPSGYPPPSPAILTTTAANRQAIYTILCVGGPIGIWILDHYMENGQPKCDLSYSILFPCLPLWEMHSCTRLRAPRLHRLDHRRHSSLYRRP